MNAFPQALVILALAYSAGLVVYFFARRRPLPQPGFARGADGLFVFFWVAAERANEQVIGETKLATLKVTP